MLAEKWRLAHCEHFRDAFLEDELIVVDFFNARFSGSKRVSGWTHCAAVVNILFSFQREIRPDNVSTKSHSTGVLFITNFLRKDF